MCAVPNVTLYILKTTFAYLTLNIIIKNNIFSRDTKNNTSRDRCQKMTVPTFEITEKSSPCWLFTCAERCVFPNARYPIHI